MVHGLSRVLEALAGWLERLFGGAAPQLVPVPVPVEPARRRRA